MNKKFLVILGRGLEGCGVTRIAIEFTNYVNSLGNDYQCNILANSDKKWGRESAHQHNAIQYKFSEQIDDVKREIDKYDVVFAMSVPAKKFDDASKDSFFNIIKYAKESGKMVVMSQWDHKIHSISRNMYADAKYWEIFNYCDLMLNHSYTNDFAIKFIKKNNIQLRKLVCRDDKINNLFGIDFEALKPFWKPFEQKGKKTIKFIGRSAGWKGPWKFRDLHWSYFKDEGYISTIEGIELSIGVLNELYKSTKPARIERDDVKLVMSKTDIQQFNNKTYPFARNMPAYVLPPYNRNEAIERLSKNQFGIELILMDDNLGKDIIENAMMEMVGAGVVPIFRKQWAKLFTINGIPLYDYGFEKTGTIFLDDENPRDAIALMNELSENAEKYDNARNIAYKFYKNIFDNSVIYKNVLEIIENAKC